MLRSIKIVLFAIAVAAVAALGTQAFRTIYSHGYQRGADSVATAVDAAKVAQLSQLKDSLRVEYAARQPAIRDSDASVQRNVSALNDRVAQLRQKPVPTVAVTAAVDSAGRTPSMVVKLAEDSVTYRVQVPVGLWIQLADQKLVQDDSVIGGLQYAVNVRFPALLAMRDGENALLTRTIDAYDSLGFVQRDENAALKRRVAALTPSTFDRAEHVALYALATYGAIEGGRRLLGGR